VAAEERFDAAVAGIGAMCSQDELRARCVTLTWPCVVHLTPSQRATPACCAEMPRSWHC
jgi:hypothetical protein